MAILVSNTAPLLLLCGAACSGSPSDPLPAGDPAQPDIVFISVDTLRADRLGAWGHDRPTSPFFDRLAEQGTRFSFARSSSPWTLPAHTTMLTGQLPRTHKVIEDSLKLDPSTPVLPALLQGAGYRTGGFVSTLYVSSLFDFDRGFDRFEDFDIHSEKVNLRNETTADELVDEALSWWSEQPAGEPVFLFLHTYDVHYHTDPPPPYDTMFDRAPRKSDRKLKSYFHSKKNPLKPDELAHQLAQYDEAIRFVDDQFARIEAAAQASGRQVRFIITSDHGEEFGERGSWGHAHTLYAEQLHVPLIFSGGGLPKNPGGVAAPAGIHDIAPTVAAWVGQAAALQPDGLDLNPVMTDRKDPQALAQLSDRGFTAETTRFKTNRVGLYQGGLRLEWDLKTCRTELFDPHADPKEATDLAKDRPEDLARMQAALLETLGTPWEATQPGRLNVVQSDKGGGGTVLGTDCRGFANATEPGQRFQVLPYDAQVSFSPAEGAEVGPVRARGEGSPPGPDAAGPLRYHGGTGGAATVTMSDDQQDMLSSLGYVQGDEEEEAPVEAPPPEGKEKEGGGGQ